MLRCGHILLVVSFPKVCKGFRSWSSPLWITPRNGLFLSRIGISYQVRPENFIACPTEAFNLVCPVFRRMTSLYMTPDIHNLGPFLPLQNSNWSLGTFFSRTHAGFPCTVSMSKEATVTMNASVSRLETMTYRITSIITRRPFSSFPQWTQNFQLESHRLCELSRQSDSSLSVLKKMLASGWEFLAPLHFIPRCPHGLPWQASVENCKRLFLNKTQYCLPL